MAESPVNPFEAPSREAAAPAARVGRPGCRQWAILLLQRALLLLVVPVIVGGLGVLLHLTSFWIGWAASLVLWLPTTVVLFWAWLPVGGADPNPVVLSNGLVMERSRFQAMLRANAVDRVVVALLLVAASGLFVAIGGGPAVVVPLFLLLAFWFVWFAWNSVRVGDAVVAYVTEDFPRVVTLLEPVVRRPRLNALFVDQCRLQLANARLRLEDVDGALADLRRIRFNRLRQANLIRAQVLAGQGRIEEARRALEGRGPRNLGEQLAWEMAQALLAIEEGRAADAVSRARSWDGLRGQTPDRVVGALDLLEAAALALEGRLEQARTVLASSPVQPMEQPWMAAVWPKWWSALEQIAVSAVK
ncbi:MAG: hypothetical protein JRJ84_03475 [Deltaproteobacteria bacterium]|nr:hypothetical protein [Deltaproteobacteria bacterium]